MGTKPEISQRYPKNIELDESQGPAGTEGFDTVDLKDAKTLLDELAG